MKVSENLLVDFMGYMDVCAFAREFGVKYEQGMNFRKMPRKRTRRSECGLEHPGEGTRIHSSQFQVETLSEVSHCFAMLSNFGSCSLVD